jgi:hypothetical protein
MQPIAATATNMSTGTCLDVLPGTVRPYTPAVTAATGPCFVSDQFTTTLNLGGIPMTLYNTRIAATYVGNPATTLINGVLAGFISETDANNTIIPASFPLIGGMPLSSVFPGGTGNCSAMNDKDTNGTTMGWWVYFNFPATRVSWSDN